VTCATTLFPAPTALAPVPDEATISRWAGSDTEGWRRSVRAWLVTLRTRHSSVNGVAGSAAYASGGVTTGAPSTSAVSMVVWAAERCSGACASAASSVMPLRVPASEPAAIRARTVTVRDSPAAKGTDPSVPSITSRWLGDDAAAESRSVRAALLRLVTFQCVSKSAPGSSTRGCAPDTPTSGARRTSAVVTVKAAVPPKRGSRSSTTRSGITEDAPARAPGATVEVTDTAWGSPGGSMTYPACSPGEGTTEGLLLPVSRRKRRATGLRLVTRNTCATSSPGAAVRSAGCPTSGLASASGFSGSGVTGGATRKVSLGTAGGASGVIASAVSRASPPPKQSGRFRATADERE
jgi:hypothetical protein